MYKSLKKLFYPETTHGIDASVLFKKWLQHPVVKGWHDKGWLRGEEDKVLNYMLKEWETRNVPIPPPHRVKSNTIEEYQKESNYAVFIETGTYLGRMIDAQKNNFKKIYSVEIDKTLFENAVAKYKSEPHIHILMGDSAHVLGNIMQEICEPAIFWLDAHYHVSKIIGDKKCPIFEELDAIFASDHNHILLIDDARLFIGKNDYPTLKELSDYVNDKNSKYKMEINNDIIRLKK